jgi:hypothetical protein
MSYSNRLVSQSRLRSVGEHDEKTEIRSSEGSSRSRDILKKDEFADEGNMACIMSRSLVGE